MHPLDLKPLHLMLNEEVLLDLLDWLQIVANKVSSNAAGENVYQAEGSGLDQK